MSYPSISISRIELESAAADVLDPIGIRSSLAGKHTFESLALIESPMNDASTDLQTIDPAQIAELRMLETDTGEAFFREVVDLYIASAPAMLAEMREAVSIREFSSVIRVSHSLRSCTGQFGAKGLEELCGKIEAAGRAGQYLPLDSLMDGADLELSRVVKALVRERDLVIS